MISRTRRVLHNIVACCVLVTGAIVTLTYDGPDWLTFLLWAIAVLFSTRGAELVRMSDAEYTIYAHTGWRSTDRPRHPF